MRALVLLLACLLLVTGCGGTDEEAPPPVEETAELDAAGEEVVTIEMRDNRFHPESVAVQVGQTVRWINEDSVPHDAAAVSGADFESELFGEGETFEWTPEQPGTVEYVCTVHPGMEGAITVVE
jgi:plastocyanin